MDPLCGRSKGGWPSYRVQEVGTTTLGFILIVVDESWRLSG